MYSCEFVLILFIWLFLEEQKEDVEPLAEEQELTEVQQKEEGEEIEGMETPPGDWWTIVYSFDEVVQMIDNLPRKHKAGMKGVAKKGVKAGKKRGGKVSDLFIIFL